MNDQIPPEFEARLQDLLAAPDADAAFVNGLRSELVRRPRKRTYPRFVLRVAWAAAIALGLLAVVLLAFSPQVVRAMQRLLGYIPGVGFVEKGPALRVLSAPVTFTKDGLTLTVEEGAADAQRTVLLARVEGYPRDLSGRPSCTDAPQLVSADGAVRNATSISAGSDAQNPGIVFVRYEFQPMTAHVLDVTLEIPCVLSDADYAGWLIPLHFEFAQGTDQVFPVIELPTAPGPELAPTGAPAASDESAPAGFSIALKSAVELEDGYVLSGSYQWSDTRIDNAAVVISHSNMVDAAGQDVPFEEVPVDLSADSTHQEIPFAYRITGKDFAWPLDLVVYAISVVQPGQGTFQFDAGPDPQIGQTWNVDIDVPVGQHVIHVQTIRVTGGMPNPPGTLGFEFTMTSDPSVASALVQDLHPIIDCASGWECGGGGGGGGGGGMDFGVSGFDGAVGPFVNGWVAQGYSPAGIKTFVISDVAVFIKGPWGVSWQPSPP